MVLVIRGQEAAQASGNPYVQGAVAMAYGRVLGQQGQTDAAAAQFAVATARFAEIGDERLGLAARSDFGHALRRGGRLDEAMAIYRETIGGWVHLGHRAAVANQLENIAYVAISTGRFERAARLFGAAEAIRTALDAPMALEEGPEYERYLAGLRDALDPVTLDAAWDAGRASSFAEAVAFARAEDSPG
jgi:tetratricopeptide (TPR) repeat protein